MAEGTSSLIHGSRDDSAVPQPTTSDSVCEYRDVPSTVMLPADYDKMKSPHRFIIDKEQCLVHLWYPSNPRRVTVPSPVECVTEN